MMSIGVMSAANIKILERKSLERRKVCFSPKTNPFSPFRILLTTSLTPLFTCLRFDATNKKYVNHRCDYRQPTIIPFLTALCSFLDSFLPASGWAIGERSARLGSESILLLRSFFFA